MQEEPVCLAKEALSLFARSREAGEIRRIPSGFILTICIATQWTNTLSSKANLPHAINFRALCSANLVTLRSKVEQTR